VELAGNGRAAVELVRSAAWDLILMDCQMPEMDGFEATRRIRDVERPDGRVPIIAMTANAMQGDRERCLAAGMDDYLSKPLEAEGFSVMLDRWVPADAPRQPSALDQIRTRDVAYGPALARELCDLFLRETPTRLDQLARALDAGDLRLAARTAHSIKGSCWVVGAGQMGALAEGIEHRLAEWSAPETAEQVASLAAEFDRLRPALEAELTVGAAKSGPR
jgi:CheY-like chemotaxis protein